MENASEPPVGGLETVVDTLRELAREVGGARAARAVTPEASLERHVGLGSLERVELLSRLEARFGRRLDERCLRLDTPRELADAIARSPVTAGDAAPAPRRVPVPPAAPPPPAGTLGEALWARAQSDPQRLAVHVREDDGSEWELTYAALMTRAAEVGGALRQLGISRGDTVALVLPTGRDFLHTFLGIQALGAIPVPLYPPARPDRLAEYAERQAAILASAEARLLVGMPELAGVTAHLRSRVAPLERVLGPRDLEQHAAPIAAPVGAPDDPALIQYTSGSTGRPKGVLLTHANLLANIRAITQGLEARPTDVGVSWLPLYHDMGLIGSWLFCLHAGLPLHLMSPLAFLTRPERWLWALHAHGGTLSGAPNFAYELCVRRIADAAIEGLDLSAWRCALNGAEAVNPETLRRFNERFAPYGLRPETLMPVYGLAEISVALCFPPPGRGARVDRVDRDAFEREGRALPASDGQPSLGFVSEGAPLPGHEVRIADEQGREVGDRRVGRVQFRGPSTTSGYYRNPEATLELVLPDGWLDSGDLAYLADGEIHVTGRRKDLIIKAGRNLVPHEIEEVAGNVAGVRRGCVAAFGTSDDSAGTERLVVVAETRLEDPGERERLRDAVTQHVVEALDVPPDEVVLVSPGAVPKTSSGKIRRAETRSLYLSGDLGGSRRARLLELRLLAGVGLERLRAALARAARAAYALWLVAAGLAWLALWWPVTLVVPPGWLPRVQQVASAGLLRLMGCRFRYEGRRELPAGPVLLASNHASYTDVLVLLAMLPRPVVFMAKHEVFSWPLLGRLMRAAGHIPVDREDARRSLDAVEATQEALRAGAAVLVFPEATFTPVAGLRAFRLGVFEVAVRSRQPVVPLALRGTRRLLRDGAWLPTPGVLSLWTGDPIAPEGSGWSAAVGLRDRVAEAIAEHCGEPRLGGVAGHAGL